MLGFLVYKCFSSFRAVSHNASSKLKQYEQKSSPENYNNRAILIYTDWQTDIYATAFTCLLRECIISILFNPAVYAVVYVVRSIFTALPTNSLHLK